MGFIKSLKLNFFYIFIYLLLLVTFKLWYDYNNYLFDVATAPSFMLWVSGVVFLAFCIVFLNSRIKSSKLQYIVFIFIFLVYIYVTTQNMIVFFFCYELFLLPSFFIVLFGSPNRRGVIASIYFLIWTQIGSFLVFLATLVLYQLQNSMVLPVNVPTHLILIFLIGFGIKIPVWPAHYWLTKTHVEAPTYFSIYLSGFLVKTALYGLWVFCFTNINEIYVYIIVLGVLGVLDSSLKMWAQIDLKKLIAYATVQEMNLILICAATPNQFNVFYTGLFILAHTLLSTLFFLLIDSIYKRFSSRSVYNVRGLLTINPSLGWCVYIACLFFTGAPFTLKFLCELFIYIKLNELNLLLLLLVIIVANWIAIIGFCRNWYSTLFGVAKKSIQTEITYRELIVYSSLFLFLFILPFLTFLI